MAKYILYLLMLFVLTSCLTPDLEKRYKKVVGIGGLGYFSEDDTPPPESSPIDQTKEKMTVESYNKISVGISIFVIAFVVSIAFSNPITHKLADIGMAGGGVWALIGMVKLFVATYLFWFCVAVFILLIFGVVYKLRGHSIINWIKNKRKPKSDPNHFVGEGLR